MDSLKDMQQEDVCDELRKNDDDAEEQIVHEVSLSNLVALRYLGLVGEEADEDQCHWHEEKGGGLRSISGHAGKESLETLASLHDIFLGFVLWLICSIFLIIFWSILLRSCLILMQVQQLQLPIELAHEMTLEDFCSPRALLALADYELLSSCFKLLQPRAKIGT
jgi:hypothetical protein